MDRKVNDKPKGMKKILYWKDTFNADLNGNNLHMF